MSLGKVFLNLRHILVSLIYKNNKYSLLSATTSVVVYLSFINNLKSPQILDYGVVVYHFTLCPGFYFARPAIKLCFLFF